MRTKLRATKMRFEIMPESNPGPKITPNPDSGATQIIITDLQRCSMGQLPLVLTAADGRPGGGGRGVTCVLYCM